MLVYERSREQINGISEQKIPNDQICNQFLQIVEAKNADALDRLNGGTKVFTNDS